jgi:hypothetical protein
VAARCRALQIEPPTPDRIERIVRGAVRAYEDRFLATIHGRLAPEVRDRLDALLHEIELYRRRVAVQPPSDLRRLPEAARLTWLAAFVHLRGRALTDSLVELLIDTVHAMGARAERRVEQQVLNELRKVSGKHNLLFEIANASLAQPDGTVRQVIFPVVGEQTLHDLVREWQSGPLYRKSLRTTIRNSYAGHYRRMVPRLLDALDFRSNNAIHRPVIAGLAIVKRYAASRQRYIPSDVAAPMMAWCVRCGAMPSLIPMRKAGSASIA